MRARYNTLVIPYYKKGNETLFCIMKRADKKIWQFVAGGGENIESPRMGAYRELSEELGIAEFNLSMESLFELTTIGSVTVNNFEEHKNLWREGIFVIPVHCFAYNMDDQNVIISKEHTEIQWLGYNEAESLLFFDLDKTALWELSKRIETDNFEM